ncbi:MAG: hypothetical protein JWO68_2708 [Actinomycetia bacterium]|nr:hypothetical protein [Actinomycetes bacterium]
MRARVAGLTIAAIAVAACGARVTPEQVRAASGTSGGAARTAVVGSQAGAAGSPTTLEPAGPTGASADVAPAGTTATTPGAAAVGDNGGATDVGVTPTQITLGNVATLSGPVPGLFAGATFGTQAWAAYQNSLGGINGRKIKVDVHDDQFDTGQNRSQTVDAIGKDFAMVGSFSLYDDAAVHDMERAGVTSIQIPLTSGLQGSPNNFAINPVRRGAPTGPWKLFKGRFPGAITSVGAIYPDIASAKDNYENNKAAMQSLGYRFVYERGYSATETDFTADVVRMRSAGAKFFFTNGDAKTAARLTKAMAAQNFKPDAFVVFGSAYDAQFLSLAGPAGEGVLNIGGQAMYLGEDAPFNPELRLFLQWLAKVKPGYRPDLFAAYGWGSGRLFAQAAQDAGPELTRAGLLAAMRKIDEWNGHGMFPPAGPASKRPAVCFIVETVRNGKFERWSSPPPGFNCAGSTFFNRP